MQKISIEHIILIIIFLFLCAGCLLPEADIFLNDEPKPVKDICLLYLSHADGSEGIYRICMNGEPELLIFNSYLDEYCLSENREAIIYSTANNSDGADIWRADRNGENQTRIFSCEECFCNNIIANSNGEVLFFSRLSTNSSLIQYDIDRGEETIIEHGNIDLIDLSPNGQYLRYHISDSQLLRVLDLKNLELILSFKVDVDLIGNWSSNSSNFLLGLRNYDDKLMISALTEIDIGSLEEEILFELPAGTEYFRATYFSDESILVLARTGLKNNTKQILEIDRSGNILSDITHSPVYDHSGFTWDPVSERLAFQRYDVNSSRSAPEIWEWEKKSGFLQKIAENAVLPDWQ